MNGIIDSLTRLFRSLAFWVVVLPWQQAIRVRAGRHSRLLGAGIYLKLPILDVYQIESTRRRTTMAPTQTLATADGATVVVGIVIGYAIRDLERLYGALHHAEDTIAQTAQGIISELVFGQPRRDIEPSALAAAGAARLATALCRYGIEDVTLSITDFSFLRAFRLIQDQRWSHGRALDTQGPDAKGLLARAKTPLANENEQSQQGIGYANRAPRGS